MACNPMGSLHGGDLHHHHPALGLPGPSTFWKIRGLRVFEVHRDMQDPTVYRGVGITSSFLQVLVSQ